MLTVAGNGAAALGAENTYRLQAPLNQPRSVAVDATGALYIADTGNHRVVRITGGGHARHGRRQRFAGMGGRQWPRRGLRS